MRKALIIILAAMTFGSAGYHTTMYFLPNYIYAKFKTRGADTFGNLPNQTRILLAPDENSRTVVKPNPDFAYVSTFYDVSEGPIHISGSLPDSIYWSVAFYQPNTINYYVKNDMQYGSPNLNIVLGEKNPQVENSEFINAQSSEGFMLIRVLITDKSLSNLDRIENLLKTITIEKVKTE
tara:strand:- start:285 stop:821 length:537 start_codon:yes stop_codon:yes gene_type:complete